jgi:glycosyltransferase involved in cell wall biosynthesis
MFFGAEATASQLCEQLGSDTDVIAVPPPTKYSAGKVLRGLVGRYPLPVLNYTSVAMAQRLSDLLSTKKFDAVHLDSIHFAAYLPLLRKLHPGMRVMLNWHNIESELMERYAESTASRPRKLYAKVAAGQMRRLERSLLRECYGHVVCSDRESAVLKRRDRAARIEVIPNGVDTSYFLPQRKTPQGMRFLFVGQMSYHANAEGIGWFVREIWPAIRGSHAASQLSIVGSSPGPGVKALANEPGVEVTGTVPDLRPFYSNAYAAVVPLRTGGGTRLKILEAMAAGTPVISTRLGAEGLPVGDREHILFAEDAKSWMEAVEFVSDEQRRLALVERARQLVVDQFDWSAIGRELLCVYREWSGA